MNCRLVSLDNRASEGNRSLQILRINHRLGGRVWNGVLPESGSFLDNGRDSATRRLWVDRRERDSTLKYLWVDMMARSPPAGNFRWGHGWFFENCGRRTDELQMRIRILEFEKNWFCYWTPIFLHINRPQILVALSDHDHVMSRLVVDWIIKFRKVRILFASGNKISSSSLLWSKLFLNQVKKKCMLIRH